mmetsp:Transcript_14020/g.21879  ORF Transcript_14020/g.21879 Transcript_14020/m.21879 type:complete len:292 (-) Transcript_14020:922-1797(-)
MTTDPRLYLHSHSPLMLIVVTLWCRWWWRRIVMTATATVLPPAIVRWWRWWWLLIMLLVLLVIVLVLGGRILSMRHMVPRIISRVLSTRVVMTWMHRLPMLPHRRWHASMHFATMHVLGVNRMAVLVHVSPLCFFVLLLFHLFDWVHAVLLVSLSFIVLFIFSRKLLPSISNQACNGSSFRRHTSFRLFETKYMSRKEHVVTSLVSLPVGSLVRWLIFGHLILVSLTILTCSFFVRCLLFGWEFLPLVTSRCHKRSWRDTLKLGIAVSTPQCLFVLLGEPRKTILHKDIVG